MHFVTAWCFVFIYFSYSICYIVSVCRAFGKASFLAGFGRVLAFVRPANMLDFEALALSYPD
jgi:hypothetical protein